MRAEDLIALLEGFRFSLNDEKAAQAEIESVLSTASIKYRREVRLAPGDIIDFMVGGVGIEVKLRSTGKRAIYRQLKRYAAHEEVREILLITNTMMGLPPDIDGKPARIMSLGRAWL